MPGFFVSVVRVSVSSGWRSSGSLVVGPRDYVKISRNGRGYYVKSYVILILGHHKYDNRVSICSAGTGGD